MKRLAVLGQPVVHSLSPAMFAAAFEEVGLAGEWSYDAIELAPAEFGACVGRLVAEEYVGANVTIPHKEAALAVADDRSAAAHGVGAANTLSFEAGRIRADNTDAPGLLAALSHDPRGEQVLVLGAGGAARAAIWALREAGATVTIWNRTADRAAAVAAELGVEAVPAGESPQVAECDLLVNATALGLGGDDGPSSPQFAGFKALGVDVDQISDRQVVVDLVYGSAETELVRAAKDRGAEVIDGGEILVRQGAASFTIWTGLEAPLATMRRVVQSRST